MLKMFAKVLMFGAALAVGFAQQPKTDPATPLTARDIFVDDAAADDKPPPPLPSKRKATPKATPPKQTAVSAQIHPVAPGTATTTPKEVVTPETIPSGGTLALRYRVLLVDKKTNQATAVDAASTFHKDDCLALELEPNRSGYVYVLAKESNGNWHPLFPSPEIDGESEMVLGHTKQRTPQKYCFTLDEEAGDEHLYVVVSRDAEEVQDLHIALLNKNQQLPLADKGAAEMADASAINKEANDMVTQLGSRGFKVTKPGAEAPSEEKYSVYVAPASLTKKDTVFTDILIKHQ